MYDKGQGVTQDYAEAVRWYKLAAEQGDVRAQFNLGFMYDKGQGVTQDYAEAVRWYKLAAEIPKLDAPNEPPNPISNTSATFDNYNNVLWAAIVKHKQYPIIARMSGWQGQVIIELLLDGNGILKSKKIHTSSGYDVLDKQALEMIDKAVPFPPPPEALRASGFRIKVPIPFKLVAPQGDVRAQVNLGLMYDKGQGVTQDYAEAVRWYKLAAEQGNINAQYDLGGKYLLGFGVAQDYVMAYMWYNLAARTGDKDAVANRDIVANKLTPQQLLEAQKLARECLARNYKGC
jgi:TonB family protein